MTFRLCIDIQNPPKILFTSKTTFTSKMCVTNLPTTFEDGKMKFYILRNTPQSDLVIIDILNNLPKPYHFGSFFLKNRRHFFKFFAVYFML